MENFFDVATEEEIPAIIGEHTFQDPWALQWTKENYKESPDSNYAALFWLYFSLRNDKEKAFFYLDKIESESYKQTLINTAYDADYYG